MKRKMKIRFEVKIIEMWPLHMILSSASTLYKNKTVITVICKIRFLDSQVISDNSTLLVNQFGVWKDIKETY